MAGFLNSKQRIMDVMISNNGRRQIADGTFDIKYASFSDYGVFYRNDGTGIADDASVRLMFEAFTSNGDVIIPEINDQNSMSMGTSSGNQVVNGKVYTSGSAITGTANIVTGSVDIFSSSADIIQTAVQHFDWLQIIGSNDNFVDTKYFKIEPENISFQFPDKKTRALKHLKPMYVDPNLASQPNFKYMAPYVEKDDNKIPLASYPKIMDESHTTIDTLKGFLNKNSQKQTITLEDTSDISNYLCQVFEITPTKVNKLSIIDYGAYYDSEGGLLGQIFHIGKLFRDESNTPKFVRIMSFLFE